LRANARNVSAVDDGADETRGSKKEEVVNDKCTCYMPYAPSRPAPNCPVHTQTKLTRYKFVGRDEHGNYVWESKSWIPGDSRVEQITCSPAWFWGVSHRNNPATQQPKRSYDRVRRYRYSRPVTDACERGTVGCAIYHHAEAAHGEDLNGSCETW
jgi:hypothetical protein